MKHTYRTDVYLLTFLIVVYYISGVKAQIDAKLKEFEQLFKNKDFIGLENRYTEDCVFLPAGQNKHQGRKGICIACVGNLTAM